MWRLARDVCFALVLVGIEHEGLECLEDGAIELLVPGFEQVHVCLGTQVRSVLLVRERHGCCW